MYDIACFSKKQQWCFKTKWVSLDVTTQWLKEHSWSFLNSIKINETSATVKSQIVSVISYIQSDLQQNNIIRYSQY